MPRILLAQEFLNVQGATFARSKLTDAMIYFITKRVELFDVREMPAVNPFLIDLRLS